MLYVHFFIALSSFFIYEILQVKYNKNILSYNFSIHIKILNSIIKLQLNNHKSVKKNSFKYILRLLAGKFGRICTEVPLTTFSSQDSKWIPLNFSAKIHVIISLCNSFFKQLFEYPWVLISVQRLTKFLFTYYKS